MKEQGSVGKILQTKFHIHANEIQGCERVKIITLAV